MPKKPAIRIVIADDHPIVREGLGALIAHAADMAVVSEAANGEQAVQQFFQHRPDIVLMDLRMPSMSGLEAIQAIRDKVPDARILVLTTFDGDEDIYQALQKGAKGYLLKDTQRDQLIEAIRSVCGGGTWISPKAGARLAARVGEMRLTGREREVLQLLAAGSSNKEIGRHLRISEGTVKVHVTRILKKLNVTGRSEAITEALKRGLIHLDSSMTG